MVVVEKKERRHVKVAGVQVILPEIFQPAHTNHMTKACLWAGYLTLEHFR